jgi:hypothetical protein
VVGGVAAREQLLDPIESIRRTSIDPYASIRATYQLTRESEIRNGLADDEELPNLDDNSETAPQAEQAAPSVETAPETPPPGANAPKAHHQQTLKGAKTPQSIPTSKPTKPT